MMTDDRLLPTAVLYDVMCEAVNHVRGVLTRQMLAGAITRDDAINLQLEVTDQLDAVPAHDRETIIQFRERMMARYDELEGIALD